MEPSSIKRAFEELSENEEDTFVSNAPKRKRRAGHGRSGVYRRKGHMKSCDRADEDGEANLSAMYISDITLIPPQESEASRTKTMRAQ